MSELYYAQMEAARNAAEDAYFDARPELHSRTRGTFRAGFERAFEQLWSQLPVPDANDLVADAQSALNAAFAAALERIASLEAELAELKAPGPMAKRLAITSHRLPSGGGSIVIAFLTHAQAVDAHAWLASLPTEAQ